MSVYLLTYLLTYLLVVCVLLTATTTTTTTTMTTPSTTFDSENVGRTSPAQGTGSLLFSVVLSSCYPRAGGTVGPVCDPSTRFSSRVNTTVLTRDIM